MEWSHQQSEAIDAVGRWQRRKDPQVFRLFGFAGSGKSTLARHLAESVKGTVVFGAFTGKAALVMRTKGCPDASTIHAMLYRCKEDERGHTTFTVNYEGAAAKASLIVIDEVSMVGRTLGSDLMSLKKPILVLGDPAQLPPIDRGQDAGGFFTSAEPDVMLTEIHRQARDNPIIALATAVREGRGIEYGDYGKARVVSRANIDQQDVLDADQVLVGRNKTRQGYNARIRELLGREGRMPSPGDKLVCLKNNHDKGMLNGGIFKVHSIESTTDKEIEMLVDSEEFAGLARQEVKVPKQFFIGAEKELDWRYLKRMDQMTYGYALTVHKSQGSQWNDVMLFDESSIFGEDSDRHLYTAITRAAEKITIVR